MEKTKFKHIKRPATSTSSTAHEFTKQFVSSDALNRIITLFEFFTPKECKEIIERFSKWESQKSTISQINKRTDIDYRNSTLFVPPVPDIDTPNPIALLLEKIAGTIMEVNLDTGSYGFDLTGIVEAPNMMMYQSPDIHPEGKPGKYDWHLDIGEGHPISLRKISYSILLNPDEYEGGELEFRIGKHHMPHPEQTGSKAVGSMIVFPSYLLHRILPITKGVRYSMVGWIHGNSFK